ncbi:acetyl-CoA carboxylase biotin carboxylase subunit family protein [Psychromicrobium sp. YIM B11713]|uniref:ATP-grasp domain-containing protein n=1 Tax=Psychromicrobium sp. YIM B11713 TaxID=3145233 RepID=UPI00374EDB23
MPIYLTAMKPTISVTEGFLPAAAALGLPLVVLTDQVEAHAEAYRDMPTPPLAIEAVNVNDPAETASRVTALSARYGQPQALFSNSDHLQFSASLAAELLSLPAKDWRSALRCKNKALTRQTLSEAGLDSVFSVEIPADTEPQDLDAMLAEVPFPAVIKPREGVATEDVLFVADRRELRSAMTRIRQRRGAVALVVEEYLSGKFYTFDTLGDGEELLHIGSWHTELSEPPFFDELRDTWYPELPPAVVSSLKAQLRALGVNLGACHTEFVVDGGRARIIEVNYRLIGGSMDLFTSELLGIDLFAEVISLHCGQSLSEASRSAGKPPRQARVEYVFAEGAGRLTELPQASDAVLESGVRLIHKPIQEAGSLLHGGHTKRDYLSAVQAIGPDLVSVDREISAFLAANRWLVEA